ncbi:MAG: DUF6141 family protein [Bacteroidota bacterium]
MTVNFKEIQKFRQKWIWFIVFGLFLLSVYAIVQQIVFRIPFGNNPAPDYGLFIISAGMALLVILFLSTKLITEIDSEGIRYRYIPFHFKTRKILWSDVDKAYVRIYSPLMEYGGWGIRYSSNGKAFNVQGNKGLQLELKNGKKILFGTQNPKKVEMSVNKILNNKN